MSKIKIQNVFSKPSACNGLYYSYIKKSPFITEGEAIHYPSVTLKQYNELPEHIKIFCLTNEDTPNTKVCVVNTYNA